MRVVIIAIAREIARVITTKLQIARVMMDTVGKHVGKVSTNVQNIFFPLGSCKIENVFLKSSGIFHEIYGLHHFFAQQF